MACGELFRPSLDLFLSLKKYGNGTYAAVAAVRVFNVNALGVPDCDHSYSCIVVMRRDRFQARS